MQPTKSVPARQSGSPDQPPSPWKQRLRNFAIAVGFIAFILLTGLAAIPQFWQFVIDSI